MSYKPFPIMHKLVDDYRKDPCEWKLLEIAAHYRAYKLSGVTIRIPADIYAAAVLEGLIDV
jgi:hypothetical protein